MKRKKEQVREDVVKEEVKAKNKPDEKFDRGNEGEQGMVKSKWEDLEESVDSSQEEEDKAGNRGDRGTEAEGGERGENQGHQRKHHQD